MAKVQNNKEHDKIITALQCIDTHFLDNKREKWPTVMASDVKVDLYPAT